MGFELKNRCEQTLGVPLSVTMVWNYPTVRALAEHLAEKLDVTLTEPFSAVNPSTNGLEESISENRFSSVLAGVEQLSEEDAVNALLGRDCD
jgi:hypothetical protein